MADWLTYSPTRSDYIYNVKYVIFGQPTYFNNIQYLPTYITYLPKVPVYFTCLQYLPTYSTYLSTVFTYLQYLPTWSTYLSTVVTFPSTYVLYLPT